MHSHHYKEGVFWDELTLLYTRRWDHIPVSYLLFFFSLPLLLFIDRLIVSWLFLSLFLAHHSPSWSYSSLFFSFPILYLFFVFCFFVFFMSGHGVLGAYSFFCVFILDHHPYPGVWLYLYYNHPFTIQSVSHLFLFSYLFLVSCFSFFFSR